MKTLDALKALEKADLLEQRISIPVGTKVVITDHHGVFPRCLVGSKATVIGHEHYPPTTISRVLLEVEGDGMFKWPTLFPWMIERRER